MLGKLLPFSPRTRARQYEFDIRPTFPPVDELIARAQRCTESCVLMEQVDVSRHFFKNVALRGVYLKHYSLDEARRVSIIVDFIAQDRVSRLYPTEAIG